MIRWATPARVVILLAITLVGSATHPAGGDGPTGASATLLPDGRWLILGGQGPQGLRAQAETVEADGRRVRLSATLHRARAWHTATVLPDGTVLIIGGVDERGRVVRDIERFRPATQTFEILTDTGITPRAHHTATLLTDARILIAGGVADAGTVEASTQLWSSHHGAEPAALLGRPRRGHRATLLPDGRVWLTGGHDGASRPIPVDEAFAPATGRVDVLPGALFLPGASQAPGLAQSVPDDHAADVATDVVVALRFTKPIRPSSLSASRIRLVGPVGPEPAEVVAAEGGRLAFVTPAEPLLAGAEYTVTIAPGLDADGMLLAETSVAFTTAAIQTEGHQGRGTGPFGRHGDHHGRGQYDLTPPGRPAERDDWAWHGERRDGKPYSPWQSLPPLLAPPGVTALSGQVLRLNGQPLADVTLQVADRSTRTDRSGRFLLTDIPTGYQVLIMDGSTANRPGRTYGIFDYGVYPQAGQTKVLPFTIWMPLLDTQHATRIPVPTPREVVVTSRRIPGLEVRIPENVILQTAAGPLRWMSLTQIPVDRPPFPLPEGTMFFFTPQAHGAAVVRPDGTRSPKGVRMIMPNPTGLPAGLRLDLWSYETGHHGWHVYGQGTVTRDERQVVPDAGVEFFVVKCALNMGATGSIPANAPVVGSVRVGDPVDPASGLFIYEKTDLVIPDVIPIVITRKYRQLDTTIRPFGLGASHDYQMFLAGDQTTFTYAELILGDGGRIRYDRTSGGTGHTDAIMEHTATPTGFFKSRLSWDATRGGWQVLFLNGTIYRFVNSFPGPMLTEIEDRWGHRLTITRTTGGGPFGHPQERIARITSPNGRWVDVTYGGGDSKVTQLTDNIGRTVTYAYDGSQRLTSVTDTGGGVTEYTYDASHRMATIEDARNIVFLTNEYDAASRVIRQTQADSTTWEYAYTLDGGGKIIQTDVTNPRAYVRRLTFNAAGRVLTDTHAHGTGVAQTTTYTRHATSQRVETVTDALSRQTTYAYDTNNNVTSVTRLAGTGDAVTTSFTYESGFQQIASVTDPLSHTTTFGYTSGNLTSITDPLSHATTLTYNTSGRPLTVTTPAGTTTLTYEDGDVVTVTDPTSQTTTRFSDAVGRPISVTNPLGQRTRLSYDALNRLTQTTDPRGGATQFGYDANGNLLSLTDARSNATTYAYNSMDRVTTRTDPLIRAETYTYDDNGNLASVTDRKSQTTSLTYDALDRPTQRTFQGGATIAYTWDAGNRLTQVVDSVSGTITRTYDGLDRVLTETTPNGTVTYTYDTAGRRATMAVPGQTTISYGYDNADRLTSITQGSAVTTFEYDDANRRTRQTLPNGVKTEYAYDAASRLTGLTYKLGAATLGALTYTYDPASQRTKVGGSWARTLIPTAVASATYDAANQQTAFSGQTQTFDLNGNLTGDGTNTYTWDARNQLASISGPTPASFVYDPLGRRQRKTVNGTVTDFVYDGLNPVKEVVGATTVSLLTGLGIDEYLTRTVGGTTEYLLSEALGSTVALADGGGSIATEYSYAPFGAATTSGTSTTNEFGYTGREHDGTGVYYYRARYYHPTLQRFISEDPIGLAGGDTNVYSYVFNSPIELRDPSGLAVDPVSLTAFAIFCGGGAVVNVTAKYVLAGRKVTLGEAASAAALGCGAGVVTLTAGIAAGVVATGGILAGDVVTTGPAVAAAADQISKGHAFVKHVVERGEFPAIRTRAQFADVIERTMSKAEYVRQLSNGRTGYWKDGVVVIRNPGTSDGGTAFVPKQGLDYFWRVLQ
jgi:RHS repeat-associated protein